MYKLTNNPGVVERINPDNSKTVIYKGDRLWSKYETWLAEDNTPEPAETDEEVKSRKKVETESLAGEKADALLSKISDRRKMKQVSRAVKLVFKKVKGTISPNEETELATLEVLDDKIDDIYDAADTIFNEIDNDSSYDHIDSNHWPQS
jgi:hypothetical protein